MGIATRSFAEVISSLQQIASVQCVGHVFGALTMANGLHEAVVFAAICLWFSALLYVHPESEGCARIQG